MYHIPNDKRAYTSSEKVYHALKEILKKKDFIDVTVSDISKKSGISRATVYRLFDNITDVLLWKCDFIMKKALLSVQEEEEINFKKTFNAFAKAWMDDRELMDILIRASRLDILYNLHAKYSDEIMRTVFNNIELSEKQKSYVLGIMSGSLPSVFNIWVRYEKEDESALYKYICESIAVLGKVFSLD